MSNVVYINNPLLTHKISSIRGKEVSCATFRQYVKQIAVMETYEAMKDFETVDREIETPIKKTVKPFIEEDKIVIVPILRAGIGMQEGVSAVLPGARVHHIGMRRDEVTHLASTYYCNLPASLENNIVLLVDPMLATGGSALDAIKLLKEHGAKDIRFLSIIAVPEGVKAVSEAYPDVKIYIGALDERLNENCFITPGLGDAGDRIFGTL